MREIQRTRKGHGINHQRSPRRLPDIAVYARFHEDIGWIKIRFDVRADRAEGVKTFCARELHIFFLQIARGDIVQAGVAQHVVKGIAIR